MTPCFVCGNTTGPCEHMPSYLYPEEEMTRDEAVLAASRAIGAQIEVLLPLVQQGRFRRGYGPDIDLAAAVDKLQAARDNLLYALENPLSSDEYNDR
jgi:hypothetical protein